MSRLILLANGGVTLVDGDDWERASQHRWYGHILGSERYYAMTMLDGKRVYLHRFLMEPSPELEVDHVNGDSLDNRRSNLRAVTHRENLRNRRRGYGVTGERNVYVAASGRYVVKLHSRPHRIHVGTFPTLSEAVEAAACARALHFGEA